MAAKVFIRRAQDVAVTTGELLDALDWQKRVSRDSEVYVKLNLSSVNAHTLQCANTNREVLETIVQRFREVTSRIYLCESDGMHYTALSAFRMMGFEALVKKYDVRFINLSEQSQTYGMHPLLGEFGLPSALVRPDKVLVTLPIIKTHTITTFTGALKNNWGLIPRRDRMLLHKHLHELIPIIAKIVNVDFSVMGGPWAMEGRGPTNGRPRRFPVMLASTKLASLDATECRLIGLDPMAATHLVNAAGDELGPVRENEIAIDGPFEELRVNFEPARFDWALRCMDYLSRYSFFTHQILMNRSIFMVGRASVQWGRRLGIVR